MKALTSVIIPTMQGSDRLGDLLAMYSAHPRVGEILVINNSSAPLASDLPKVRVLDQHGNIYVNPAWNLGFLESKHTHLIISNDDITVAPSVIDHGLSVLDKDKFCLVGLDTHSRTRTIETRPKTRPAHWIELGYGALMFIRSENYQLIPEDLKIMGGDDWLFWRQPRPNALLIGHRLITEMGTTSGKAEFTPASPRTACGSTSWCTTSTAGARGTTRSTSTSSARCAGQSSRACCGSSGGADQPLDVRAGGVGEGDAELVRQRREPVAPVEVTLGVCPDGRRAFGRPSVDGIAQGAEAVVA